LLPDVPGKHPLRFSTAAIHTTQRRTRQQLLCSLLYMAPLPGCRAESRTAESIGRSSRKTNGCARRTLPRWAQLRARHTPEAVQARIEGSIYMRVVVLENGNVGDVVVTQSLDKEHGLDQAAIDAVRQWEFEPGMKDGQPVAVEVEIEMRFSLKK
jgi:TonB family protein